MENLKTILDACLRVYGEDFTVNNRKRNNVYARAAFYKVCKLNTNETLDSIGKMCKKDHATVLHVTGREGNKGEKANEGKHDEYLLIKEYRVIFEQFKVIVNGLVGLKNETQIESYYKDLINKIESLDNENKELRKELFKLKAEEVVIVKQPIQTRITNTIMGLSNEILEDFEKYRLNPYLKLQESKVNYKHLNKQLCN